MSRRATEALPRRNEAPTKGGTRGATNDNPRSEISVLQQKVRQGTVKKKTVAKESTLLTFPGDGEVPPAANGDTMTRGGPLAPPSNVQPRVALVAGSGGIETPARAETPEGAYVALEVVGGFARRISLKDEICWPSPPASISTRPPMQSLGTPEPDSREGSTIIGEPTAVHRAAATISALAKEARDELDALRNISKDVKTSVCGKLQHIAGLALCLEESRSRHILEVEREKAGRSIPQPPMAPPTSRSYGPNRRSDARHR